MKMTSRTASCPACSAPVSEADSFCGNCGHSIAGECLANQQTAGVRAGAKPHFSDRERQPPASIPSGSNSSGLYAEYDSRKLNVLTGYVAAIIGFSFGLHRIYAKKHLWWVYLILAILGALGSILLVGFVFWGILGIWLAIDLAMMPNWVGKHNQDLRQEVFGWMARDRGNSG